MNLKGRAFVWFGTLLDFFSRQDEMLIPFS